jgi:hypothetical protein
MHIKTVIDQKSGLISFLGIIGFDESCYLKVSLKKRENQAMYRSTVQ